jgi:hypothetical protein
LEAHAGTQCASIEVTVAQLGACDSPRAEIDGEAVRRRFESTPTAKWANCFVNAIVAAVIAGWSACASASLDRRAADVLLNDLRYALSAIDEAAVRSLLTADAELVTLSATSDTRRIQGASDVAKSLLEYTGSAEGPGPALRVREGFVLHSIVVVAESLPRVAGEPTRLVIYRFAPDRRIARIWVFPSVPSGISSSLAQIVRYREKWSTGQWSEVAPLNAPDIQFLEIAGGSVRPAGSLDERRRCFEAGFRNWRTRRMRGAHPNDGCNGGPIEVVQGIGVGPYVVTVEKRWWATDAEDYSGRMFFYVADSSGVRRVYYVLWL